jgi:two-component system response regulator HydG
MSGIELLSALKDINPFVQVMVLTAFGSVESAVEAMKSGACDYLTKPVEDLDELVVRLNRAAEQNRLVVDSRLLQEHMHDLSATSEIIGESIAIRKVREMISVVAPQDATVLITGESGTGKELVARAIHSLSPRREHPLVAINCAAFPETLLESELFGYEKGAFTGADRTKQGRFELANGGTLFLDEIGEMPTTMQVKLLRVLEERQIERLGSVKSITLDIRIITATNRDLESMISDKTFREDLYYRLNVITVNIPPLRDRRSDILLLAESFLDRNARRVGKDLEGIDPSAASSLTSYDWPGNVRELENVIERAVILARGTALTAEDITILDATPSGEQPRTVRPLEDLEKEHIRYCLDQLDWNIGNTAEALGIHRNTLRSKIKQYGLTRS